MEFGNFPRYIFVSQCSSVVLTSGSKLVVLSLESFHALHFIFELHVVFYLSFLRRFSASEEPCSDMLEFAGGKYFL